MLSVTVGMCCPEAHRNASFGEALSITFVIVRLPSVALPAPPPQPPLPTDAELYVPRITGR
jgi:hypothetical protein